MTICRPPHEPAPLGSAPGAGKFLQSIPMSENKTHRLDDRAPAPGAGGAAREGRAADAQTGPNGSERRARDRDCGAAPGGAAAAWPRPGAPARRRAARGDLEDVPVGVAEVDGAEAAALERLGALRRRASAGSRATRSAPRADSTVAPGGGSQPRPDAPGPSTGTRGRRSACLGSRARRRTRSGGTRGRRRCAARSAGQAEQVAVEGRRAVEVATDQRDVVQPGQAHAALRLRSTLNRVAPNPSRRFAERSRSR